MPKVIGKDPKHVKTISCKNCAAIIEFTMSETKRTGFSDWTGDTDYYQTIDCPNCNENMIVKNA